MKCLLEKQRKIQTSKYTNFGKFLKNFMNFLKFHLTIIIITIIIDLMIQSDITVRKHSAKRDAILEVLRETTVHPGAQWVYDRLKPAIPDLSLGTVYRNLNLFRQEGLALSLGVVNGEERFDGITEPHPHLICGACGAVEDIPVSDLAAFEEGIGRALRSSLGEEESSGGEGIDFRRTLFYGLCKNCRH
jgi:Fur family peroxide stress response transcriptional regulator